MDYEVFLMTRIRELHDRGHSTRESVSLGLERTGGVISGAALVMIAVFGAFMLSSIVVVKELGFALATAVLIDATLMRIVLVPAVMSLLGERSWWFPRFMGRIPPKVGPESGAAPEGAES